MDFNPASSDHRRYDVLAIGGVDIDWLFEMPELPGYDKKLPAQFLGRFPGGPVGNFACIGSRLGLSVAAYCTLGRDEGGKILLEDFKANGVDTTFTAVVEHFNTPFVIVIIDPTGEKAVIVPESSSPPAREDLPDALQQARFAYFAPADYAECARISALANQHGTQVMVDLEGDLRVSSGDLEIALKDIDIASFNEQGYFQAFGHGPSVEHARRLLKMGPAVIIITRGERGVLAVTEGQVVEQAAYPVRAVDSTGAGDTFNAGFLNAIVNHHSLEHAVRFGCAAAALVITTRGTRTSMPDADEVERFIANNQTRS